MTKKNAAAQALRAIPSARRAEQSRINGRSGGRPRTNPPDDPDAVIEHKDGTVSYWLAAKHRWVERIEPIRISANDLARLPPAQRLRLLEAERRR